MQSSSKKSKKTVLREIKSQYPPFDSNFEYLNAMIEAQLLRIKSKSNGGSRTNQLSLSMDDEKTGNSFSGITDDFSAKVKASHASGIEIPLEKLFEDYDLSIHEKEILRLLVSLQIEWRLYTDFRQAYNCGEINVGSIAACLSVSTHDSIQILSCFDRQSNLIIKELIELDTVRNDENFLKSEVKISGQIVDCALDGSAGFSGILDCVKEIKMFTELDNVVLAGSLRDEVIQLIESYIKMLNSPEQVDIENLLSFGGGLALLFHGPSGTGKTMLARAIAKHTSRPLLTINPKYIDYHGIREEIIYTIYREAKRKDGIVFFDECDDLFQEDSAESRALLNEIENHPVVTILITNNPEKLDPALSRRIMRKVFFTMPDVEHRKKIWEVHIPDSIRLDECVNISEMARRYRFSGGQIRNAVQMAVSLAFNDVSSNEKVIVKRDALIKAAEAQSVGLVMSQEDNIFLDENGDDTHRFGAGEKALLDKVRAILHHYKPPDERLAAFMSKIGSNNTSLKVLITCPSFYRAVKAAEYVLNDLDYKITCKHVKSVLNELIESKEEIMYSRRKRMKRSSVFESIKPVESILVIGDQERCIETAMQGKDEIPQTWLDLENHLVNISDPVIYVTSATQIPKKFTSKWFHYRICLHDENAHDRKLLWKHFLNEIGVGGKVGNDAYEHVYPLDRDLFKNLLNILRYEVQVNHGRLTAADIKNIVDMIQDDHPHTGVLFGR